MVKRTKGQKILGLRTKSLRKKGLKEKRPKVQKV